MGFVLYIPGSVRDTSVVEHTTYSSTSAIWISIFSLLGPGGYQIHGFTGTCQTLNATSVNTTVANALAWSPSS